MLSGLTSGSSTPRYRDRDREPSIKSSTTSPALTTAPPAPFRLTRSSISPLTPTSTLLTATGGSSLNTSSSGPTMTTAVNAKDSKDLTFAKLCDLKFLVEIKILDLQGVIPRRTISSILKDPERRHAYMQTDGISDLYVTIQLFSQNQPLTLPFQTGSKIFKDGSGYDWNTSITLPVQYASLPIDSQIVLTVWDIEKGNKGVPVGGSCLKLFGRKGTLKRGQQRCYLHLDRQGDSNDPSETPSDVHQDDELGRLLGLVKDFERGDMPKLDWLDAMAFREIGRVQERESRRMDKLFLNIDLPRFDFPVVFAEAEAALPSPPEPIPDPLLVIGPSPVPPNFLGSDSHLWKLYDPESMRIREDVDGEGNPVEAKYRRLARSHRTGRGDRELKPGPEMRDLLNDLFRQPPTYTLSPEDKDLIWRYRFSIHTFKRSLTKFLKSVTWSDVAEARQAVEVLLPLWSDVVGMDDALEMLGPDFEDSRVRAFAVKHLAKADDDELLLYLLQLVQALKFESRSSTTTTTGSGDGHLLSSASGGSGKQHKERQQGVKTDSGLADFLIERAVHDRILGTALHWYLMVECEDRVVGKMFARVAFQFMTKLVETEEGILRREELKRQGEFVGLLSSKAKELRTSKDARPKKIDKLRAYLADHRHGLSPLPSPLSLPLNPRIEIIGISPERSSVFKSNLFPMLLWLETEEGEYPIIFKNGDDLRQDQLVLQLFTLMDRLLRKENLDLKLSPYAVLATGSSEGMIQFVPSKSLAGIMGEHGSLLNYLKIEYGNEGAIGTLGVEPSVLDTFIRSCGEDLPPPLPTPGSTSQFS